MNAPAAIAWKDLRALRGWEVAHELAISLPWLLASCFAASAGGWATALAASFMFFLTGLRQVHNAYHYALGLSRGATEWVMFAMSLLMLGSMHAVQVNHLRHHRYCLGAGDVEAMSARLPWWRAIALGPLFPIRLHAKALEVATPRQRRWILGELAANAVLVAAVATVADVPYSMFFHAEHHLYPAVPTCKLRILAERLDRRDAWSALPRVI